MKELLIACRGALRESASPSFGDGSSFPVLDNCMFLSGERSDGVVASIVPADQHPTKRQVPGSKFSGAGSATVTGLLTTDTITASCTAPTCGANGTLTIGGDCWDIYVHRSGVLWAYWPGINIGETTELDASGNGNHLTALTTTTIVECTDGTGTDACNEDGFSERTNIVKYSELFTNAAWTKNAMALTEIGDFWKMESAAGGSIFQVVAAQGYTATKACTYDYVRLAISTTARKRLLIARASDDRVFYVTCDAYEDGNAPYHSIAPYVVERVTGDLWVGLQQFSLGGYFFANNFSVAEIEESDTPNPGIVVCLGDSISLNYPNHLAKLLPNASIVGAGVGGDTIRDMIDRFADDVAAESPDVIVGLFGSNSILTDGIETLESDARELLDLMAATGADMVVVETLPRTSWTPEQHALQLEYNALLESLCDEYGATWVPMYDEYLQPGTDHDFIPAYTDDGTHPTVYSSYNYLAEGVAEALGWSYPGYVGTDSAPISGRQPADFQSFTDYPGPLRRDMEVVSGDSFDDFVLTPPAGPQFAAIFGTDNIYCATVADTDTSIFGSNGIVIYEPDTDLTVDQLYGINKLLGNTAISDVEQTDIFVTFDFSLGNIGGSYPAIGIKDGGYSGYKATSAQDDGTYRLIVGAYVFADQKEATIIGDDSTGKHGALDLVTDIISTLKNNTLGRFDAVAVTGYGESQLLDIGSGRWVSMIPINIEYEAYEE